MNRIEELKKIIHEADYAYYELSKPIISDFKYDELQKELFELTGIISKPSGFINEKFSKVKHEQKMLSLQNSYSKEDIDKFKNDVIKESSNWNKELILQNKLDGLACSIIYKSGKLILSATRGNGEIGENITENVIKCINVPLVLKENINCEIRGELIISKSNFIDINSKLEESKKYSNPRNLCSGTMRLLDSNLVQERKVEFVPYGFIGTDFTTHKEEIDYIKQLGFDITKLNSIVISNNIMNEIDFRFNNKQALDYEIDGLVIKVNDLKLQKELGFTSKFPKGAIAFKFKTEQVKTRIISVDYQIGKTGIITPVANLESVEITGTTVKRASLHNFDEIKRKDIKIGDLVTLEKAAEIIPYIVETNVEFRKGTEKEILVPIECPVCKSKIIKFKDTDAYCCSNKECDEKKIQKLIYQTSKDCLDIKGLSEKTIRNLYNKNILRNLKNLFELKNKKEDILSLERFGEKSLDNILKSIESSKLKEPNIILNTLDIHTIGRSMSKKLINELYDIDLIFNSTEEELLKINDFGVLTYKYLQEWKSNKNNLELYEIFKLNGYQTKIEKKEIIKSIYTNKTVCITGSFENYNRNQIIKLIEERGGKFTNSVSKKTDILICGTDAGSKLKKAKELKINIIKESELKL